MQKREMPEAVVVLGRGSGSERYCHVFTEKHCTIDKLAIVKNKWPFRFDYIPENVPKIKLSLEGLYLNEKDCNSEYGEILHIGSARLDLDKSNGLDKMNTCVSHASTSGYELFEYHNNILEEWDVKKLVGPFNFVLHDIE